MVKSIDNIPGMFFEKVTMGAFSNREELRQAIVASGKRINFDAGKILDSVTISPAKKEVYLWSVSGKALGFTDATSQPAIYERVFSYGLSEAPAEAIVLARIDFAGEEWQNGGMKPAEIGQSGRKGILSLSSVSGSLWLSVTPINPNYCWDPSFNWLFEISHDLLLF
jgi:hypothetical protein